MFLGINSDTIPSENNVMDSEIIFTQSKSYCNINNLFFTINFYISLLYYYNNYYYDVYLTKGKLLILLIGADNNESDTRQGNEQ